jgi:HK97 family phage prohead protease
MTKPYDQKAAFEVAEFKALDTGTGEFEALVSVFGNIDHGGDRVIKGAFAKSLGKWEAKGDPIPVIWNHMWDNPEAHIGVIDPGNAKETDDGLLVKGRIDLDNPFAKQVYRLLKERRVTEFSFGYNLLDAEKKNGALELMEIDLFEVGPTLKGMNPATELLAVKALAKETAPKPTPPPAAPPVAFSAAPDPIPAAVKQDTGTDLPDAPAAATKAGARHSKETLAALTRMREEIDALIASGQPEETPKSDEAEAQSKASDPDADIRNQIRLLKEM